MPVRDLLIISDLHLGEDLGRPRRTERLERELVAFLDHHRSDGTSWRLVINGDMLELAGIVLRPDEIPAVTEGRSEWERHEHHYGLGSSPTAAVTKMQAIAEHHVPVFQALGRFLRAGHLLSVVMGNHDAELHWPEVQEVFRHAVVGGDHALGSSIEFHPWYFYEPGVAWVEHGHQYDPYCSFEHVVEPTTNQQEIDPNVGFLLMRYIASHFDRDLHHVQGKGFFSLMRVWLSQKPSALLAILRGYVDMSWRLAGYWIANQGPRRRAHQARVAARLRGLTNLPDGHHSLTQLWEPPVVLHPGRLVRALMMDRLGLLVSMPLFLLSILTLPSGVQSAALLLGIPVLMILAGLACQAREPMHPGEVMRARAHQVLSLIGAPFVVMGHSHQPCHDIAEHGAYLNTGTLGPAQ